MGNWENLYLEIYDEVSKRGANQAFYAYVDELSNERKYRYKDMRELWRMAFEKIKQDEA